MPRVKRGSSATRKRERLLKETKGYRWHRKSKEKAAREALFKAWTYQYRDRRNKRRDLRRLWQVKINAAARNNGTTYARLMHALGQKKVNLDRKILADLAENEPRVFSEVVSFVGSSDGDATKAGAPAPASSGGESPSNAQSNGEGEVDK